MKLLKQDPEYVEVKLIVYCSTYIEKVHYHAGVYIVELTQAAVDEKIDFLSLMDSVAGEYPSLGGASVRGILDDNILIILNQDDPNLTKLIEKHYETYPDYDFICTLGTDTLKDIAIEDMSSYMADDCNDNIAIRVGGTDRDVDYSNFTVGYSKTYDIYTVIICGGILIEFMKD